MSQIALALYGTSTRFLGSIKTMTKLAAVVLLLAGVLLGAESKYVLNYKRLSTRSVGISCANGGDPTGNKVDDVLIISCGR
jgi:hypothetical protein